MAGYYKTTNSGDEFDFVAIGIVYPGEATLASMRTPSFAKRSGN